MSGEVVAKAFIDGIGECYIEPEDDPRFIIARHIKSNARHRLRREHVSFRPGKYREDHAA